MFASNFFLSTKVEYWIKLTNALSHLFFDLDLNFCALSVCSRFHYVLNQLGVVALLIHE